MYDLELTLHEEVALDLNLCLKHDLGNRIVNDILWTTEPTAIRKLQKCVPKFIQRYFLVFRRGTDSPYIVLSCLCILNVKYLNVAQTLFFYLSDFGAAPGSRP